MRVRKGPVFQSIPISQFGRDLPKAPASSAVVDPEDQMLMDSGFAMCSFNSGAPNLAQASAFANSTGLSMCDEKQSLASLQQFPLPPRAGSVSSPPASKSRSLSNLPLASAVPSPPSSKNDEDTAENKQEFRRMCEKAAVTQSSPQSFCTEMLRLKKGGQDFNVSVPRFPIDPAWAHYAGNISREFSNHLLLFEEPGSFLIRRKSANTLILSFVTRCPHCLQTVILSISSATSFCTCE